jgi:hypothetical protein
MKEERPVVTRRKPTTALEVYCKQRRIDGAGEIIKVTIFIFSDKVFI